MDQEQWVTITLRILYWVKGEWNGGRWWTFSQRGVCFFLKFFTNLTWNLSKASDKSSRTLSCNRSLQRIAEDIFGGLLILHWVHPCKLLSTFYLIFANQVPIYLTLCRFLDNYILPHGTSIFEHKGAERASWAKENASAQSTPFWEKSDIKWFSFRTWRRNFRHSWKNLTIMLFVCYLYQNTCLQEELQIRICVIMHACTHSTVRRWEDSLWERLPIKQQGWC